MNCCFAGLAKKSCPKVGGIKENENGKYQKKNQLQTNKVVHNKIFTKSILLLKTRN